MYRKKLNTVAREVLFHVESVGFWKYWKTVESLLAVCMETFPSEPYPTRRDKLIRKKKKLTNKHKIIVGIIEDFVKSMTSIYEEKFLILCKIQAELTFKWKRENKITSIFPYTNIPDDGEGKDIGMVIYPK